jgi:hypothetical protein
MAHFGAGSDTYDPNRAILRREQPFSSQTFDPNKPVAHLVTLKLAWAVLDVTTAQNIPVAADGGHFKCVDGHQYNITILATDTRGVQTISLDGSGMFKASTEVDNHGIFYETAGVLPASIPHQEFINKLLLAPTSHELSVKGFDYFKLSCGVHQLNGMPDAREFFVFDGVMTFRVTATDRNGDIMLTTLMAAP